MVVDVVGVGIYGDILIQIVRVAEVTVARIGTVFGYHGLGLIGVVMAETNGDRITISHEDWVKKGKELFGEDLMNWKFVCPSCGHIASIADWKAAGASEGEFAFSCIGRSLKTRNEIGSKKQPCNYAGGGLFRLNPVTVTDPDGFERETFEFASNK